MCMGKLTCRNRRDSNSVKTLYLVAELLFCVSRSRFIPAHFGHLLELLRLTMYYKINKNRKQFTCKIAGRSASGQPFSAQGFTR